MKGKNSPQKSRRKARRSLPKGGQWWSPGVGRAERVTPPLTLILDEVEPLPLSELQTPKIVVSFSTPFGIVGLVGEAGGIVNIVNPTVNLLFVPTRV